MDDSVLSTVVGPLVRHALTVVAGILVTHGWYTGDEGTAAVTGLVVPIVAVIAVLWASISAKIAAAKVTQAALALPAGSSLGLAKAKAANS